VVNGPRPIVCFDLTLPTPAENLACEEALLDQAEARGGGGFLRFWESPVPFVVLGHGNKLAAEVNLEACRAAGVPVLRRCSGGGTVLQGPGCVNYALILPIGEAGPLATITGANRFIMERHRDALAALLGRAVTVEGHTDLAVAGRKFSGNAQRRKRTHLLFHGSFLLNFDLALIEQFLLPPPRQPEYRLGRGHLDFLTRIDVTREDLVAALLRAWEALPVVFDPPGTAIAALAAAKYSRDEWNLKW
jgi:lipoate-protein ligase A